MKRDGDGAPGKIKIHSRVLMEEIVIFWEEWDMEVYIQLVYLLWLAFQNLKKILVL